MTFSRKDQIEIIENAVAYIVVFAMLAYGIGKVVQFNHSANVTSKVSDLTGMQLMWAFYGYSYPFVITLGVLEVVGGILMFFRKTCTFNFDLIYLYSTNKIQLGNKDQYYYLFIYPIKGFRILCNY